MRFFYLLIMLWLAACSSGGPVEVGGIRVEAGLRALADHHAFDYTGYLDKALKGDDTAFEQLLQFNAGQDSAAAIGHALVLNGLLEKLGDELFSKKIEGQTEEVKRQLWASLELAGTAALKNNAPLTLKALIPNQAPTEHRGLYVFDSKNSTFRDCSTPDDTYLAVDETGGNLEKNYRRLLKFPYPNQPIYAEVKGYKAPYYGNLQLSGEHAGFFVVTEILDLETKNFRNTCIPYDLWALGTEPFWYAQVSEAEGIIEYRGMDDEQTKVFAFQPPLIEEELTIYTGVNQDSGDNIRISVENKPCSDGMSETTYKLGVRLTINGRELHGCGIPFEVAKDSSDVKSKN